MQAGDKPADVMDGAHSYKGAPVVLRIDLPKEPSVHFVLTLSLAHRQTAHNNEYMASWSVVDYVES